MAEKKNERRIFIKGDITDELLAPVIEKIMDINSEDKESRDNRKDFEEKPIELIINSFGGSVYAANGLMNIMDLSKTPIHTYCTDKAMSAGFCIFVNGHKRFAHEDAVFMLHDMSFGMHGTLVEHKERAEWFTELGKRSDRPILKNTRISKEELEKTYKEKRDWYMTGQEALKLDVCQELIKELF